LVGKPFDKWPYFEGYELSEDKIKLNHRKIPNHHPASLALKIIMVVCTETLLKTLLLLLLLLLLLFYSHLIQATKSYR